MFTNNNNLQYIHTEIQDSIRVFFAVTLSDVYPIATAPADNLGTFSTTIEAIEDFDTAPVTSNLNLYPTQLCEF